MYKTDFTGPVISAYDGPVSETLVNIAGPTDARPVEGRTIDFIVETSRAQLIELAKRMRDRRLKTNIGNVAAFDEAVAAFALEVRLTGKTIIRIGS